MRRPPIHLLSIDLRRRIHLLAFVEHAWLYPDRPVPEHPFFLGIYCAPFKRGTRFYVVLVDEDGIVQRRLHEAGDTFEYALLVASAMFPIGPEHVRSLQTHLDHTLFHGHLSPRMGRYRKLLGTVRKRLARLNSDRYAVAQARADEVGVVSRDTGS